MSDYLLGLLLRWPLFWRAVGNGLASLAVASIALGLRLGRRIDRAEHAANRVGAALDIQLESILPWWLWPFVPETALGFAAWTFIGLSGALLAITAKRIKRLLY